MKDKIRKLIFITAIIYSIVIVCLMVYSYGNSINAFEFNDSEENKELLNKYKGRMLNIEDNSCKNAISDLIGYYEDTSYNGLVNLKDKYLSEKGLLSYIPPIIDNCNLKDDVRSSLALKTITASIQFDEIASPLFFQYELRIPDLTNRSIQEVYLNSINYNINRKNILETIELLLNFLEGDNYE